MIAAHPIRLMIVDDHYMVREGLKTLLSTVGDIEVIGEAADGAEALAVAEALRPDVVLMDVVMPNMDGPTATLAIIERLPETRIVALSSFVQEELARAMLDAGAIGYLLKDASPDKVVTAVREAARGHGTVDRAVLGTSRGKNSDAFALSAHLTPREREVLGLIVTGLPNKQIASRLSLSTGTVRLHVSNILAKMGAANRTEAAMMAVRNDLLS